MQRKMKMAEPLVKDLLKLKTRKQVLAYAKKKQCKIAEGKDYIYVGVSKCVFDANGKLLFIA